MSQSRRVLPGEEIIWVLIFGEMTIFAFCILIFLYFRQLSPELFFASQVELILPLGLINTLVLITSSLFVAMGLSAFRQNLVSRSLWCLASAFGLGVIFCILKTLEFSIMGGRGLGFETNAFYTFYYVLAGVHLMHVLIGLLVIGYFFYVLAQGVSPNGMPIRSKIFESGTDYWHMVDLVWILLFSVFYLLP